jgi:hypothetical protein
MARSAESDLDQAYRVSREGHGYLPGTGVQRGRLVEPGVRCVDELSAQIPFGKLAGWAAAIPRIPGFRWGAARIATERKRWSSSIICSMVIRAWVMRLPARAEVGRQDRRDNRRLYRRRMDLADPCCPFSVSVCATLVLPGAGALRAAGDGAVAPA